MDILNTLRTGGRLSEEQLFLLSDPQRDVGAAVELSPVRQDVDDRNTRGLAGLSGEAHMYGSQDFTHVQPHHPHLADKGRMDSSGHLVGCAEHRFPPVLTTKYRMPVILLTNLDTEAGLVNGTQGRIVGYTPQARVMAQRAQEIATTGEFTRFEEERITAWVTLQGRAEFSLPVVRFENGE